MAFPWVEKYHIFFELNNNLSSFIDKKWSKQNIKAKNLVEIVTIFNLSKAHKTQRAILVLCKSGYGEDAAILLRSLLNIAINQLYIINRDADYRAERFVEYSVILGEKLFNSVKDSPELKNSIITIKEDFKKGQSEIDKIKTKHSFNKNGGWSGKGISDMAKEVGLGSDYNIVYRLLCNIEHSDIKSLKNYIRERAGEFIVDTRPSDNWIEQVLASTFSYVFILLKEWNRIFDLKLNNEIDEFDKKLVELCKH